MKASGLVARFIAKILNERPSAGQERYGLREFAQYFAVGITLCCCFVILNKWRLTLSKLEENRTG
jgi:hypothetical protein